METKPAAPAQPSEPVKADFVPEVTEAIPVKSPTGGTNAAADPASNPITGGASDQQNDTDKVLEEVSGKVKAASAQDGSKPGLLARFRKKPVASAPDQKSTPRTKRPILIGVLAILIALGLSAAAFAAFSEDKPATPPVASQQNAQSSVTTADIDSLDSDMQAQLRGLNDTEDFDSTALSDSSLGL